MVSPTLEYASCVWDPHRQEDIQTLKNVQRQVARYACNNFTERQPGAITSMLENLKWDSLEQRRLHNRLGMLYRIQNGLVDINSTTLCPPLDPRTRGAKKIRL